MSEPVHVVTITVDQLREIVDDAVSRALERQRDADRRMTLDEAADYTRRHRDTLRRKAKVGEIPSERAGRDYLFRKLDLDDWLGGKT